GVVQGDDELHRDAACLGMLPAALDRKQGGMSEYPFTVEGDDGTDQRPVAAVGDGVHAVLLKIRFNFSRKVGGRCCSRATWACWLTRSVCSASKPVRSASSADWSASKRVCTRRASSTVPACSSWPGPTSGARMPAA